MMTVGLPSPDEVSRQIREARHELSRGRALFYYLQEKERKSSMVKLFLAIVVVPASVGVLTVFDGISTALAAGLGVLGSVTAWARKHLDGINRAEEQVEKEIEGKRGQWQKKTDLELARTRLESLSQQIEVTVNNITQYETSLK